MDKFVIRTKRSTISCPASSSIPDEPQPVQGDVAVSCEKRARLEVKHEEELIRDPGLRKSIDDYNCQDREAVRRKYVIKGPCQPFLSDFPRTDFGSKTRSFQLEWFIKWEWLEYSVSKDAAFCFWCYLFKKDTAKRPGTDVFVKTGFRNWKKATERFSNHVGAHDSTHNDARARFFAFKDQALCSRNQVLNSAYQTCSTVMLDAARLLLELGLTFQANDEAAACFLDGGNFLEFLDWFGSINSDAGKVLKEYLPGNDQLSCPSYYKKIISACALETTKAIVRDIGDKFFSLLIGGASDNSEEEQMTVIVRYVNEHGAVVERFLGVAQIVDIHDFFGVHGLSMSRVRGQGCDMTSNMREQLNRLKTLILNENPCARYSHCFSQEFHSVIVAVSNQSRAVSAFFVYLSEITKMVSSPCKLEDEAQQKQHEKMVERLENGEISTTLALIQETNSVHATDTRWGSHCTTVNRLLSLWSSINEVLENIFYNGTEHSTRGCCISLAEKMASYQFVFVAHYMKRILGLTNALSEALQLNNLDMVAAVDLVQSTKRELQEFKENGWDELLNDVNSFCTQNDIIILSMEDFTPPRFYYGRTYYNHFRDGVFDQVIDTILHEMEDRFNEQSMELLTCLSCLDPKNLFSKFNESKLYQLAELLYPQDFSSGDLVELTPQLLQWILEMRGNVKFSELRTIEDLAKKMVEVGCHTTFHLVYRLIELALVLPVVTAAKPRTFSSVDTIMTELHNKLGADFSADYLVCYVEKEVFKSVGNDAILKHFQEM